MSESKLGGVGTIIAESEKIYRQKLERSVWKMKNDLEQQLKELKIIQEGENKQDQGCLENDPWQEDGVLSRDTEKFDSKWEY